MKKSKSNDSDPFAAALRILTRRDHSEAELRRKLVQLGFSVAEIDHAVDRCLDHCYLDDRRFAIERARSMMRSGRGVGRKVLLDLRQRGISEDLAYQAVDEAAGEHRPAEILRELLERRYPDFEFSRADQRERRRVIGFFQRRGFSLDLIFSVISADRDNSSV